MFSHGKINLSLVVCTDCLVLCTDCLVLCTDCLVLCTDCEVAQLHDCGAGSDLTVFTRGEG